MPLIVITKEAHNLIKNARETMAFRETGRELPNGMWTVPVQVETFRRLPS